MLIINLYINYCFFTYFAPFVRNIPFFLLAKDLRAKDLLALPDLRAKDLRAKDLRAKDLLALPDLPAKDLRELYIFLFFLIFFCQFNSFSFNTI